jgi:hypothetical protein
VRVVSREWLAWIEHGAKARARTGIGCKGVQATENLDFSKGLKGAPTKSVDLPFSTEPVDSACVWRSNRGYPSATWGACATVPGASERRRGSPGNS